MNLKYLNEQAEIGLSNIKQLVVKYLKIRQYDKTYEEQVKEYGLRDLNITTEIIIPESINKTILERVYTFYIDMNICDQLIDHIIQDINMNIDQIEHNEEISINKLLENLYDIKVEVEHNVNEAKNIIESEDIPLPNPMADFDKSMERRVRDFLIIQFLIDKLNKFCEIMNQII
ncbi:uncharacterized protein ACRADG_007405 [Cochliomyia hominivorax]